MAGTNGKGSVCYKVAHALMASNMTTGLFVSPHISSFGERMQVNGQPIYLNDIMVRKMILDTKTQMFELFD